MESLADRRACDFKQQNGPWAGELLDALPLPPRAKAQLAVLVGAPDRHYHGPAHLELLWGRHRRYAATSNLRPSDHLPIAFAIAYHDAIYQSAASDNEARSAALWLSTTADGSICSDAVRSWVADTILATSDHLGAAAALDPDQPDDLARQWLLDLDLTPLGEAPETFDDNMIALAAEMQDDIPSRRQEKLLASLRHFATARPLYRSPTLRHAFEAAARDNIARRLGDTAESLVP